MGLIRGKIRVNVGIFRFYVGIKKELDYRRLRGVLRVVIYLITHLRINLNLLIIQIILDNIYDYV
jgi:hypothetical protein